MSISGAGLNIRAMSIQSTAAGDPAAALSAFARIVWREIVSLVVLSVLFVMASLSVVTIGAALISLVDTYYSSVTFTGTGGGVSRRTADRANHFVKNIWTYLRTGVAYTALVILGILGLYYYFRLALFGGTMTSFALGVVGLYGTVLVFVVLYRAANVAVHADDDERPGIYLALKTAWGTVRGNLAFTSAHLVIAAILVVVSRVSVIALVVPLPALLALLEVVMYEELEGVGAKTLTYAYEDPQS